MAWKRRYSVLSVLFAAWLLCYADRMVMASAVPFIAEELRLSPSAMGWVMSAFFVGYAAMQIPGGMLVDRFGPGRVMLIAVLSWSLFTGMTGLATSLAALLGIRILFGVCEGAFPSSASKTIALWFPPQEVGRANGAMLMSIQIGAFLAPSLVAFMVIHWGWRSAFYFLLAPGIALAFAVKRWIKDLPAQGGEGEARGSGTSTRCLPTEGPAGTGISALARNPIVLWCLATAFLSNLASWGLMNWLPTYLLQVRGFSIEKMGTLAPLPFLAGAMGYLLGGHVSDRYFRRKRQIPILCGLLASALFTYLAAQAPTGETAIGYLAAAFLFLAAADSGICTLPLVIVPREAVGSAFGLVNTASQVAGFISPILVGYTLGASGGNFGLVFSCFVGFLVAAALAASRIRQAASPESCLA